MSNQIIDIHIYLGAPKDEESGCFWSEEFTKFFVDGEKNDWKLYADLSASRKGHF